MDLGSALERRSCEQAVRKPVNQMWASQSLASLFVDRWGQKELGQSMWFFSICLRAMALALSHELNSHGGKNGNKPALSHCSSHQNIHPLPLWPKGHPNSGLCHKF